MAECEDGGAAGGTPARPRTGEKSRGANIGPSGPTASVKPLSAPRATEATSSTPEPADLADEDGVAVVYSGPAGHKRIVSHDLDQDADDDRRFWQSSKADQASRPAAGDVADEPVSKSQRKREHHAVQRLIARVLDLPDRHLDRLDLDPTLRAQIVAGRRMQRGTRKRHVRYLARLMSGLDMTPVQALIDELDGHSDAAVARFKRVERWRDRLVEEDSVGLQALLDTYPAIDFDRQHLRHLLQRARAERDPANVKGRYAGAGRELFRYLKSTLEPD